MMLIMRRGGLVAASFALASVQAQQPFDLDQSFQTSIGSQNISSVLPLADGKIMVTGKFDHPDASIQLGVARLNANGTWDQSFDASNLGSGHVEAWNDKFYVQGTLIIRRILYDGAVDNSFAQINTIPYVSSLAGGDYFVYPDGRVLVSGTYNLSDSIRGYEGDYNLIWLGNEGYLDTTAHHRACNGHIEYIHPLPDGKFLLGGFWSVYDGTPTPNSTHLIRVFADGALDTTFHCPISWSTAFCHLVLPEGKHLVGGAFRVVGDPDTIQVMRLLPDGAIDPTFNYHQQYLYAYNNNPSYAGVVGFLPVEGDRTILVGGFTSIGDSQRGGIALIDQTGNVLDDLFADAACGVWNDGFGDSGYIAGITPAPDGSYYIYGSYHGYNDGTNNDVGQRMVSRLYGLDVGMRERERNILSAWPNPGSDEIVLNIPNDMDGSTIFLNDMLGRVVYSAAHGGTGIISIRTAHLSPGAYRCLVLHPSGRRYNVTWIKS